MVPEGSGHDVEPHGRASAAARRTRHGVRYRASRGAVTRWALYFAVLLAATVGLSAFAAHDGSRLGSLLAAAVLVAGTPLVVLAGYRLLLESGIAPRVYVDVYSDHVDLWTVLSRLGGRRVRAQAGAPATAVRQYPQLPGFLGASRGGWVIISDSATRITVTVYHSGELRALEGLVERLLATGAPLVEGAPVGRP